MFEEQHIKLNGKLKIKLKQISILVINSLSKSHALIFVLFFIENHLG